MTRKLLGYVGVDSGQLLVTDPCYIDSEWKNIQFQDIRLYRHRATDEKLMYLSHSTDPKKAQEDGIHLFEHYNAPTFTGKTMNQMIEDNDIEELEVEEKKNLIGNYSYAGACETTNVNKHQLNFDLGHPGAGVVFNSGYGDGNYPVYGEFNDEGRCIKVEIDMS